MGINTIELEPSKDNLFSTLAEDILDRNRFVWRFVHLCDSIEGKYSISVNARWGEGKTFFVKQAKLIIEAYNPFSNTLTDDEKLTIKKIFSPYIGNDNTVEFVPQVCVYYDSWINDNDVDPILSLMYEITKSTACDYPFKKGKDCVTTIARIADFFTGRNAADLAELAKGDDFLEKIKCQREIHSLIENFLDSLLAEQGNRLIVFIDELDRCKPTYAVQLLERIKHYFSNDRITFVFSVNLDELQHTIKSYYGEKFNALRYLDRFFNLRIELPPAKLNRYFEKMGLNYDTSLLSLMCKIVIEEFSFSLREIGKYYRTIKIAISGAIREKIYYQFQDANALKFSFMVIIPIAIGLYMKDIDSFNEFIKGNNPQLLIEIMDNCIASKDICRCLLSDNETFREEEANTLTYVQLNDKLTQAYKALFSENDRNDPDFEANQVGMCSFYQDTKLRIINAISMLSVFSNYE